MGMCGDKKCLFINKLTICRGAIHLEVKCLNFFCQSHACVPFKAASSAYECATHEMVHAWSVADVYDLFVEFQLFNNALQLSASVPKYS